MAREWLVSRLVINRQSDHTAGSGAVSHRINPTLSSEFNRRPQHVNSSTLEAFRRIEVVSMVAWKTVTHSKEFKESTLATRSVLAGKDMT